MIPSNDKTFEEKNISGRSFALTDLGNAERLIAHHGNNLRFHGAVGHWLHWNGIIWKMDKTGEIHRLANEVVRSISQEAAPLIAGEQRESLYKHMLKSESSHKLRSLVKEAEDLQGVQVEVKDLDANQWLLNVCNGTIDLRTGTLLPHRREDLMTKNSSVQYEQTACCPRWEQFLHEVFCDDEELIGYAQRFAGYCLTGDTSEQCLLFMVGKGANGKSVLLETLRKLLGDYAQDTSFATFLVRKRYFYYRFSRVGRGKNGDCQRGQRGNSIQ